ncbi:hypothetical protein IHE45_01G088700 [Dioscorea alata]|uniref:Uncharacterized protein n=1 Tax=Dioscorea alata TaxID=55571 RepID=A0ACB7WW70_DIOAL|nr:hypothetical protein IHE45_01G088700 [Dioscorea alata]
MGGGSTLRTAGRPVAPGMSAPAMGASPAKPPGLVSFSPSSSSSSSPPLAAAATPATSSHHHSPIDGEEEQHKLGISRGFIFGPAPSVKEAEDAISILEQMVAPLTLSQVLGDRFVHNLDEEDRVGQIPPSIELLNQRIYGSPSSPSQHLHSPNASKVLDAFRLLKSNPSVQRMVVSLSSDENVWNAVMNNELVQKLRTSLGSDDRLHAVKTSITNKSSEGSDIVGMILGWIYECTKMKIVEIIGNIMNLMSVIFHSSVKEKNFETADDLLRSSLMLAVMVFIIVIVTRIQRA